MEYATMKKQTPETAIKKQCIDYMSARGFYYTTFSASTFGKHGLPDGVFVRLARREGFYRNLYEIFFVEFKSADGKLSPAQEKVKFEMQAWGLPYCVVRTLDDM